MTLKISYAKPKNVHFTYGTAGFRMKEDLMPSVSYRMGLLAALRSLSKNGNPIGVMITASHNPEEDNGLKIVESDGEMLEEHWEDLATQLANVSDEEVDSLIEKIKEKYCPSEEKDPLHQAIKPLIIIGRDTRPSGIALSQAVIEGALKLKATIQNLGLLTTPQLHLLVAHCYSTNDSRVNPSIYHYSLAEAYKKFMGSADLSHHHRPHSNSHQLIVDAANGVGAAAIKELIKYINKDIFNVTLINDGHGKLNQGCGADYVKVHQAPPEGLKLQPLVHYASLDGDADRVVCYFSNKDGLFRLLDGDRIASLAALYITNTLEKAHLRDEFSIGVVQTAYANGNATKYLTEKLGLQVPIVCTGVKHLHAQAKKFDIGIYFEANGHGTVLFGKKAIMKLKQESLSEHAFKDSIDELLNLSSFINPTVGDAISDLLMVEGILSKTGMSLEDWYGLYEDLPNVLLKVQVKNRSEFIAVDADRKLKSPKGIQEKIDHYIERVPLGRAFVRPSGTENVVRIYAEAKFKSDCDKLALHLANLIYDECGGVGKRPSL